MDNLSVSIKSIRSIQQQPNDELDQFISICQVKDRELAQYRQELQRIRQTLTEITHELNSDDARQLMQKLK